MCWAWLVAHISSSESCSLPVTTHSSWLWHCCDQPNASQTCGIWHLCTGMFEREQHLRRGKVQEVWKGKQNAWKRTLLRTWLETHLWKKAFHDKGDAAHSWPTPGLQVAFGMARTQGRTTDHARAEGNEAATRSGGVKQGIWEWQTVLHSWPSLSLGWRHWERMTGETKENWD